MYCSVWSARKPRRFAHNLDSIAAGGHASHLRLGTLSSVTRTEAVRLEYGDHRHPWGTEIEGIYDVGKILWIHMIT